MDTTDQQQSPMQGNALQIEYVDPHSLHVADYNPRIITDEELAALKGGIKEFGLVDPIIARAEDRLVVGGHQRLRAAIELGLEAVPVVFQAGLTDERAAALNVLLNNPKAQGSWDMRKLSELLSELDATGFDATLTGFAMPDLEGILTWTPPGAFTPSLDPKVAAIEHTAEDVEKADDALQSRFQGERKLQAIICPHCAGEFYVDLNVLLDLAKREV